jgi:hypothetical protein
MIEHQKDAAFPIPAKAMDDRLGILGTSGSGKTYSASTAVERLMDQKARVVVIDPLGVWYGLRLMADGKTASPYNVAIFGGPHGDLPLTENAGALIGETAASIAESCIVDLSELPTKASEIRFMTAFLDAMYRKSKGGNLFHLIVDEADLFAPQKPQHDETKLLNRMEQIVRRGRVNGFIPWLITQRSAVLNKNVLSMVRGLVAFAMTSSQDRNALDAWIEGQADQAQGKAIKAALPTLKLGQAVVWLPSHGILRTEQFPLKKTFDSSRAPKRGEKRATRALKPLDLGALKDKLSTIEAETKANDPTALKIEIARLTVELKKAQQNITKNITAPDPKAIEAAEQRGYAKGNDAGFEFGYTDGLQAGRADALQDIQEYARQCLPAPAKPRHAPPLPAPPRAPSPKPAVAPAKPRAYSGNGAEAGRPLGAERNPLAALASAFPAGMTEAQWAVAAGLKRSGGTWGTYLSRLKTAGRIEKRDGVFYATEQGIADLGGNIPSLPQPGPELVAFWAQRISGASKMLCRLAEVYPGALSRAELAADLEMTESGGTFGTYISRLRSPGLIEIKDGKISASPSLMEPI